MSETEIMEPPKIRPLSDAEIDVLFAAAGIVLDGGDADELRTLARSMLEQARRISAPLPYDVEPASVFKHDPP